MPGLKKHFPDFTFSENKVAPSEIDTTKQYIIALPQVGTASVGTAVTGGTSASGAIVFLTKSADYPRNLELNLCGTHGSTFGSAVVNGKDQFGNVITETIGINVGNAGTGGGTIAGTKVFAQLTNGTITHGTHPGTSNLTLGWGTTGTTALFGLPDKIGGTADIICLASSSGILTGGSAIVGGTVGALVDTTTHAIKASQNVTGTTVISVLYRPSYDSSGETNNSVLTPV